MATKEVQMQNITEKRSSTSDEGSDILPNTEKRSMSEADDDNYPDGGLRAWSIAVATCLVLFATMGSVNTWGVFQAYYQTHQLADQSPSSISWIGSIQNFFLFSSGLVGGPLFDRYGVKFVHQVSAVHARSGALMGVANGLTMGPAMSVGPQYFKKKRGTAMGLTISGSSIGGLVLPIVTSKMLYGPLGFGWTIRIIGFIFLGFLGFAGIVVRARFPPRKSRFLLSSAFKNKPYCAMIGACSFAVMGMLVPMFYLPVYAQTKGMTAQLAAYMVAILNGASIFGRIIPGVLSDKTGKLNVFVASSISTSIMIFGWPETKTNAEIIVFTAFYGFCSGGIISGMALSFTSFAEQPSEFGTYLGMGMSIMSVATLIGPPINGALVDHYHQFNEAAYFSGTVCLVGALIAFWAKFVMKGGFAIRS